MHSEKKDERVLLTKFGVSRCAASVLFAVDNFFLNNACYNLEAR